MIERTNLPWENLPCGEQRKCNNDPNSQAWWVHLKDGRYCFRIDFPSIVKLDVKNLKFAGGWIEVKNVERKSIFLLFLNEDSDLEVFTRFCNVLLCVPYSENGQEYADSVLRVVRQWMRFLQKINSKSLDVRRQMGIMAELLFLDNELHKKQGIPYKDLLKNWTGPDKAPNDFMFEDKSYEIKSHYDSEDVVKISNEQQLMYLGKTLFLGVYSFRQDDNGLNLSEVIVKIEDQMKIEDKALIETFEDKLFFEGFNPAEKYTGLLKFVAEEPVLYKIDEEFPHVIKKGFESAITSVKYDLNLRGLNRFMVH